MRGLRGEWLAAAAALALLLLWEASGADMALSRAYGGVAGFAWRDAWLTKSLLHDGGRWLCAALLALLARDAARLSRVGPTRRERLHWLAVIAALLLVVPLLKRLSATSCPWDLAGFGGTARYVPHWVATATDGGPGHCFPSGHATAAFAFFGLYFLWRPHRPRRARALLALTLAAGAVFGWTQLARGAHFASHVGWSGWLCWVLSLAAAHAAAPVEAAAARAA